MPASTPIEVSEGYTRKIYFISDTINKTYGMLFYAVDFTLISLALPSIYVGYHYFPLIHCLFIA